ncbi:ankyrin [Planoprotostelium fungivorum]|uniref:Ankyrin n=1 Tax=Planoprotostelium fungivorum TaxID=1890364 RepID=A0A2P6NKZ6_9EUKA|nr:ankyrin [Planoprotostelium fungivorum]
MSRGQPSQNNVWNQRTQNRDQTGSQGGDQDWNQWSQDSSQDWNQWDQDGGQDWGQDVGAQDWSLQWGAAEPHPQIEDDTGRTLFQPSMMEEDVWRHILRCFFTPDEQDLVLSNEDDQEGPKWAVARRVCKGWKKLADEVFHFHTILLKASAKDHIEAVKLCLSEGTSKIGRDKLQHALELATVNGRHHIMQLLIDAGADPSADDNSCIRLASLHLQPKALHLLMADERVDKSIPQKIFTERNQSTDVTIILGHSRNNSVHRLGDAFHCGDLFTARKILKDEKISGNLTTSMLSHTSRHVIQPIVRRGDIEALELIRQSVLEEAFGEGVVKMARLNGEVDLWLQGTIYGHSMLYAAVLSDDIDRVKSILDNGKVDPSAEDNKIIRMACRHSRDAIVELLLQDVRVDPSSNNNEALIQSCQQGHTSIAQKLISHPKFRIEDNVFTKACLLCDEKILHLLKEKTNTSQRQAALLSTIVHGRYDSASILLEDKEVNLEAVLLRLARRGDIKRLRGAIDRLQVEPHVERAFRAALREGGAVHVGVCVVDCVPASKTALSTLRGMWSSLKGPGQLRACFIQAGWKTLHPARQAKQDMNLCGKATII